MSFQVTGQNTYVALNYPKHALFFSLLRKIIIVVPCTIILPRIGLGVDGVFYAELVSNVIGGIGALVAMYFTIWRKVKRLAKGETDIEV